MNDFENAYLDYNKYLLEIYINGAQLVDVKYQKLKNLAFEIYNNVENIGDWIKNELNCIITKKTYLRFSPDFVNVYINTFYRYELIEDFLMTSSVKFDLNTELYALYSFYKTNGNLYQSVKIVSMFLKFSTYNNLSSELVTSICEDLAQNEDLRDMTIIMDIDIYIESEFEESDVKSFKKKFLFFDI